MGATAKRVIPMAIQDLNESAPLAMLSGGSLQHIGKVDIQEMLRSPELFPFIVLVQMPSEGGQFQANALSSKPPLNFMGEKLLSMLDKAVKPTKQPDSEIETSFKEITVNFPEMTVFRKGKQISLTTMEFKTLKYLIQNARRVISRDELLNEVWGYENYPCTRTVDNHILKLRHKLEVKPSQPAHFLTVYGSGYKFLP